MNYYDELNKKQAAEVEVLVIHNAGEVDWAIMTRYTPAGYNQLEGDDFEITGGYVYISVTPAEEATGS